MMVDAKNRLAAIDPDKLKELRELARGVDERVYVMAESIMVDLGWSAEDAALLVAAFRGLN